MDDKKMVLNLEQATRFYETLAEILSRKFNANITVTVKMKPEFEENKIEQADNNKLTLD